MKLTPKQRAFVDYYIQCGNATEAAKKAGYNEKSARQIGTENLSKPVISSYIQERMKQIESSRIATAEEILKYWTSVMRGEKKDAFGLDASLKDRNDAAKELGKILQVYTKKEEFSKIDDGFMDALNKSAEKDWEDE